MPLNLASPGIVIREVDLTIGRVDPTSGSTGALVAPFAKGPVNDPQLIESEEDLLQTFGQPYSTDKHFEHWMVASSYLAYGGTLQVVRAGDQAIYNASAVVGSASSIRIDSAEHYKQLGYDENKISNQVVVAKNPGTWANGIKVALCDGKADQVLTGVSSGDIDGTIAAGDAANSMFYKVTADTTFKIYNLNAVANTTVTGDDVFISAADSDAGRAAYLLGRVTYLRPAADVSWNDVQGFIDFASQVGGTDS